jgi:hypothetical protein
MFGALEVCFIVVYVVIMPLIFIKQLVWLIRDYQHSKHLSTTGKITVGQITNRRDSVLTRGGSYFVTYSYKVDFRDLADQFFIKDQEVSPKHWSRLKIGTPIEVRYVTENPKIARMTGEFTDTTGRLHAVYYGLIIAVVWLGILVGIIRGF